MLQVLRNLTAALVAGIYLIACSPAPKPAPEVQSTRQAATLSRPIGAAGSATQISTIPRFAEKALSQLQTQPACRMMGLISARVPLLGASLRDVGATNSDLTALQAALATVEREVCNGRVESVAIRDAFGALSGRLRSIVTREATALDVSFETAQDILEARLQLEVARLLALCGGTDEAVNYVSEGGAKPAPFGSLCSASQVASAAGAGLSSAGEMRMRDCLSSIAAEVHSNCGPVANDPPDDQDEPDDSDAPPWETGEDGEAEAEAPSDDDAPEWETGGDGMSPANDPEAGDPPPPPPPAAADAASAAGDFLKALGVIAGAAVTVVGDISVGALMVLLIVVAGAALTITGLVAEWIQDHPDDPVAKYLRERALEECVGFSTQGGGVATYSDPRGEGYVDIGDLTMQCMCDAAANDSAESVRLGIGSTCGDSDKAARNRCLINPTGPDDNVRAECLLLLEEDREPWSPPDGPDALCGVLDCPSSTAARAQGTRCECEQLDRSILDGENPERCEAVLCPSGRPATKGLGGACGCDGGLGSSSFDPRIVGSVPLRPVQPRPPFPRP